MEVVRRSTDAARSAAQRAGVTVRVLDTPAEMARAAELVAQVWRSADTSPMDASLLRALAHTGNYVAGAFEASTGASGQRDVRGEGALVGMSVGFCTVEPARGLHSHITCTASGRRDTGLGAALKLHQRSWALGIGLKSITWTFDPLVRRNAYFNIAKLGARVVTYLPEFYGRMEDGVNAGDESDRLLMNWNLADPLPERLTGSERRQGPVPGGCCALAVGSAGEPQHAALTGAVVHCQVPDDIVAVRERDPCRALRWRHALRDALVDAFSTGYVVEDFTRSGCYVLTRPPAVPEVSAGGG